ncbi:MAG: hypothetical protein AMXMBFR47_44780 [Planctomycetota bacterium]
MQWLTIRGARQNNLKNIDVRFPLGRFTCVTGVSGSGKSSLVNDILYLALARELNGAASVPGLHRTIEGLEHLDKIIAIDQTPIGRTPRSNPATYIKVFDEIRDLFTKLPDAKLRGYKPGRFSFNVPAGRKGGGRCEACEGNGSNKIEMDFLADVWVTCPVCEGKRFARETLQMQFKGKSIADVLEMDIQEAIEHFDNQPRIRGMLQTLHDVGLDYIKLGQPSPTLSGGEAQRIKLARELVKKPTGRTIYVLDEPTTGLHFEDIRKLLEVLHSFVDAGNTVIVIEHNLDVIKTADWIIDLGPEGGGAGGLLVGEGTPEEIAEREDLETGKALRAVLGVNAECRMQNAERMRPAAGPSAEESDPSAFGISHSAFIRVRGAAQHNLKGIDVEFPRDQMTICTGVSGSGKTSFAIDTVYTEGYRRYVESLSSYARQFLGQLAKPKVEHVEGLSPAICIEQKAASKSPRSTVGTVTEIYDYMRVLWARVGTRICPKCDKPIGAQTIDEIVNRIMTLDEGAPIILLSPVALGDGESWGTLFNRLKSSGYARVRIDGVVQETAQATTLDARRKHRVEVVVDRTIVRSKARGRINESVEHALALGNGLLTLVVEAVERVAHAEDGAPAGPAEVSAAREMLFSQKLACTSCGESYEELSPHHYSFNSQMGWCETCEGLGVQRGAPAASIIANPRKSLLDGAIAGWNLIFESSPFGRVLRAFCEQIGVEPKTPLAKWTAEQKQALLYGVSGQWIDDGGAVTGPPAKKRGSGDALRFQWRGLIPAIDGVTRNSWMLRHRLHNVVTDIPCSTCRGGRLRPDAAATRLLTGPTLVEICQWPLSQVVEFFDNLKLPRHEQKIAGELLVEIRNRLRFLIDVGLEYLTLHRAAPTLSGGEAQRIRLASQIGSGLSGVLYVLDEPTIGLHPRDTQRLVRALKKLRSLGNTLLLVEHDRDVIASADQVLDFGPRAGRFGGRVVAEGPPSRLDVNADAAGDGGQESPPSLTTAYLRGELAVTVPTNRRPVPIADMDLALTIARQSLVVKSRAPSRRRAIQPRLDFDVMLPPNWLVIRGARQNNLQSIDVPIPLSRLVVVTGVSGSGKSSLINDILWPAASNRLNLANLTVGDHDAIDGLEYLDKVINVDQSPLGATPLSNPATYTGAFDHIRELFARLPESKMRGYAANRFSFNRPGGRCDACEGYGQKRIEMHFMPDVWVECEVCRGKRYEPETLQVRFKDKTIADVLEMPVEEALQIFDNVPRVRRLLQTLSDVGLGYVQLGQAAPTLSGGEAQRVKLAGELGKPDTGRTLYILDEPTTGLHFEDVRKLLEVIHRLVDLGNSVVIVEHNLDVLKSADWIIDLGPEAGAAGGQIVAMGAPEDVVSASHSHTAAALAPILAAGPTAEREVYNRREHLVREAQAEKVGLGGVGKEVKLPWQIDGRKWHLEQRDTRGGKMRQWKPEALEFILELAQKAGKFAPTNWNDRASVEITAPGAEKWFLHALTGGEWLIECYFRVPAGTFDGRRLNADLGLKTLDERDDIQAYGSWPRVDVRKRIDGPDAVAVYVHDREEIDTPAFRKFIKQAVAAYFKL